MSITPAQASMALSAFSKMMDDAVARRLEAQCAFRFGQAMPDFVQAAEYGRTDFGLIVTDEDFDHEDSTERMIQALRRFSGQRCLIPLDNKAKFGGTFGKVHHWGFLGQGIGITAMQKKCAAFILCPVTSPEYVTIIPHYILSKAHLEEDFNDWYYTRAQPFLERNLSSVPIEWMVYTMHIDFGLASLKALKESCIQGTPWYNPYNGIIYRDTPPPILQDAALLGPSDKGHHMDLTFITKTRGWLQKHRARFQIERLVLQPSVGDFQIVDSQSQLRTVVELKNVRITVSNNGTITYPSYITTATGKRGYIFSPITQWDFLFTEFLAPGPCLLIMSRDEIPREWFYRRYTDPREMSWAAGIQFVETHVIPIDSSLGFAKAFDRVFKRYVANGSFRATLPFDVTLADPQTLIAGVLHREDPAADEEGAELDAAMEVDGPDAGESGAGRNWSRRMWEVHEEEWFIGQCRQHEFGHVYRLGNHPSGLIVFVPVPHDPDGRPAPKFEEIDLRTPMMYINFAKVDLLDRRIPTDERHPGLFLHATHGLTPSIFIITPYSEEYTYQNLDRFIVPSTTINTPERHAANSKLLISKQDTPNPLPFFLRGREMIDAYASAAHEVVPKLMAIVHSARFTSTTSFVGDVATGVGTDIDLDQFLTNKLGVLQEFQDMHEGLTFLTQMKPGARKQFVQTD